MRKVRGSKLERLLINKINQKNAINVGEKVEGKEKGDRKQNRVILVLFFAIFSTNDFVLL